MKIKDRNNHYSDEDKINFEKLNNFRKFNSNIKKDTLTKNHNTKYANSDKSYFNDILEINENITLSKKQILRKR